MGRVSAIVAASVLLLAIVARMHLQSAKEHGGHGQAILEDARAQALGQDLEKRQTRTDTCPMTSELFQHLDPQIMLLVQGKACPSDGPGLVLQEARKRVSVVIGHADKKWDGKPYFFEQVDLSGLEYYLKTRKPGTSVYFLEHCARDEPQCDDQGGPIIATATGLASRATHGGFVHVKESCQVEECKSKSDVRVGPKAFAWVNTLSAHVTERIRYVRFLISKLFGRKILK
eukprot:tig00001038_g6530.t1